MEEYFLHYIFEQGFLLNTDFKIISPGQRNADAGPDFFNAKIKIGDTLWVGNVEIHVKSSDWQRHHHQKDPAYDNIILHLVVEDDKKIYNSKGVEIPTSVMQFPKNLYSKYQELIQSKDWLPCSEYWHKINNLSKIIAIESLSIERLERKSNYFYQLIQYNNNDAENAFYQAIGKGLGGRLNAVPFELLTQSVPLKILLKHQNNLLQLEALLLGQAGFLDTISDPDNYSLTLQKEYQFLKQKYQLQSIQPSVWKFHKIRPYSFPTVRIAQFAQLIHQYNSLLSYTIEHLDIVSLEKIWTLQASSYWDTHYRLAVKSRLKVKKIGRTTTHHIIINTLVPFLFAYKDYSQKDNLQDVLLQMLTKLPSEENNIIRQWSIYNLKADNALQSQALIELKNEYCNQKRCIDCKIGHKILTLAKNESAT